MGTLSAMSLNWDVAAIADRIGGALRDAEADLRLEQAVYGLDARDEPRAAGDAG